MYQYDYGQVLIETYWNVNLYSTTMHIHFISVLIETYWNVNARLILAAYREAFGINRNILECKCQRRLSDSADDGFVLIETYWNVNANEAGRGTNRERVLIETYWNVNIHGEELYSSLRRY